MKTNQEALSIMQEACNSLSQITLNDNRTGISWLSHLRISKGYLVDAINVLDKQISKEMTK